MRKILAHINLLFALIFLISAGSAFGQNSNFIRTDTIISVTDGPLVTKGVDRRAVDIGFSIYWADRNVGASDSLQAGDFFAWGETTPDPNDKYDWKNYQLCNNLNIFGLPSSYSKYNKKDKKTVLEQEDDAASQSWGGNWRMPTKTEFDNLKTVYQNRVTTIQVGNQSLYFLSFGSSSTNISLPCSGLKDGSNYKSYRYDVDIGYAYGIYWSSTLYNAGVYDYAYTLTFYPQRKVFDKVLVKWEERGRRYGFSIRPVIDKCSNVTIRAIYKEANQTIKDSIITIDCPKGTILSTSDDECYDVVWSNISDSHEVTQSNCTIQVEFTKKETTITAGPAQSEDNVDGGWAEIKTQYNGSSAGKYLCGTEVTLEATPAECYRFVRWIQTIGTDTVHIPGDNAPDYVTSCTTDNTTGKNTLKVVVPSDVAAIDYHAVFAKRPLTVTAEPNDGGLGSITDSTGNHNYATTQTFDVDCGNWITIKARPMDNCISLYRWADDRTTPTVVYTPGHNDDDYRCTTDANGVNTLIIYNVNKTIPHLYAVFVGNADSTKVKAEEGGSASIKVEDGSNICDKTVELTATPNECYKFTHWTKDTDDTWSGTSSQFTLLSPVTEIATYTAHFTQVEEITVTIISEDENKGTVAFDDGNNEENNQQE